jgi:hypothetical protein
VINLFGILGLLALSAIAPGVVLVSILFTLPIVVLVILALISAWKPATKEFFAQS